MGEEHERERGRGEGPRGAARARARPRHATHATHPHPKRRRLASAEIKDLRARVRCPRPWAPPLLSSPPPPPPPPPCVCEKKRALWCVRFAQTTTLLPSRAPPLSHRPPARTLTHSHTNGWRVPRARVKCERECVGAPLYIHAYTCMHAFCCSEHPRRKKQAFELKNQPPPSESAGWGWGVWWRGEGCVGGRGGWFGWSCAREPPPPPSRLFQSSSQNRSRHMMTKEPSMSSRRDRKAWCCCSGVRSSPAAAAAAAPAWPPPPPPPPAGEGPA